MSSQQEKNANDIDSELRKRVLDTLDSQSSINIQTNFWFDEMMKYYGINYSLYRMMRLLRHYPDGIEPSVIAERLTILRQTVTNMADDLQKRGLVERLPHPVDRRRIYLRLLPEGMQLANKLTMEMEKLQIAVLSKFTREEMKQYLDTRMKIIQYTEEEIKKNYTEET